MRKLLAKWAAALTGLLVCILAVVFALIQNPNQRKPGAGIPTPKNIDQPDSYVPDRVAHESIDIQLGKALYGALRCRSCHSVAGEGNRRSPLDGAGSRLDAEEIRRWIVSPGEMDPDVIKPDFSYLSPDQVDLLVKYIQSLE